MNGLLGIIDKISEHWKALSSRRKIGIIVLISGVIIGIIFSIVFLSKPKYEPIFLDMSSEDMSKVVEKLKQDKVSYKIGNNTILVPSNSVSELRLSVVSAGFLPSNGKGFELFDQSKFGMTDTETKIQYQRALETELSRTIKAFGEIEQAIVHLVLPEPSVFVRDEQAARASVTLKLKNNKKLSPEQVKSIVALVSGSVNNLSKENVVVVDNNFNYLSENLYSDDKNSTVSLANNQEAERKFESNIANDVGKMLESVFGHDKVKVTVKANLDFDSKQISSIKYDTQGIIKSQNIIKENSNGANTTNPGSPIDNQASPTINTNSTTPGTARENITTNYNVGEVDEKTIKAPGQINRISTSILIDGTLSDTAIASVKNIVTAATGYDEKRGDLITIEGMPFDQTAQKKIEADLKSFETDKNAEEKKNRIFEYIGYGVAGILALIIFIAIIKRISHAEGNIEMEKADVIMREPTTIKNNKVIKIPTAHEINNIGEAPVAISLEDDDDIPDLTGELKKYATKKPDQVIEIVKSWLSEDER